MWGWSWSLVVLVRSLFCFCFRCRRTCLCRRRRCSSVIARTHPPCIRISGCLVSSRATLKQSHTPPDVVSTCRDALYWYPCSQYVRPPFPLPSPPQGAFAPRGVSSTRWPNLNGPICTPPGLIMELSGGFEHVHGHDAGLSGAFLITVLGGFQHTLACPKRPS